MNILLTALTLKVVINVINSQNVNETISLCDDKFCLLSNVSKIYSAGEASYLCSQVNAKKGWLLEIYDENVKTLVDRFVAQYKLEYKYVLLNTKISHEWMWVSNEAFVSNNRQINNEQNISDIYACYVIKSSQSTQLVGYFASDVMSSGIGALCQIKNALNCSKPSGLLIDKSCYFPVVRNLWTWYQAQNECINQGGGLATFGNLNLNDINQTWVRSLPDGNYWVGLTKSQFMWKNTDSFVTISYWKQGNPMKNLTTNQCLVMDTGVNNSWINIPCGGNYTIICMIENVGSTVKSATMLATTTAAIRLPASTTTSTTFSTTTTTTTTTAVTTTATTLSADAKSQTILPILPTLNLNPSNQGLTHDQKVGLGVGLGVSLFILLVVVVVGLVLFCFWRKKLCCFRAGPSLSPSNSIVNALDNTLLFVDNRFTKIVNIKKNSKTDKNKNLGNNSNGDNTNDNNDNINFDNIKNSSSSKNNNNNVIIKNVNTASTKF